jgi:homopolymeric O-antigen transport system permease protein
MQTEETPKLIAEIPEVVIRPRRGWVAVDWKELRDYRDLFWFLTWRNVKVRYAQSALGISWAVIQPVFSMIVFTIIFGRLVKIDSEGAPYAIFSFAALVPWTYFSNALVDCTNSLVGNAEMVKKVYFPRLILPMASVSSKLVDFGIAFVLMLGMLFYYKIVPTSDVWVIPLLVMIMVLSAGGLGTWLGALAVQYRDVKHAMAFATQLLMYMAPVVYSVSVIPEQWQLVYALNPMVGVIEGFRSALLGTNEMPWDLIGVGAAASVVLSISGLYYFRRMERLFSDVA